MSSIERRGVLSQVAVECYAYGGFDRCFAQRQGRQLLSKPQEEEISQRAQSGMERPQTIGASYDYVSSVRGTTRSINCF